MTERTPPRWKTGTWRGHPNHVCTVAGCLYATTDLGAMRLHAREHHPTVREGGGTPHPLGGVLFASQAAADAAEAAGLSAAQLYLSTPTGRTGGYTTADVRAAARAAATSAKE